MVLSRGVIPCRQSGHSLINIWAKLTLHLVIEMYITILLLESTIRMCLLWACLVTIDDHYYHMLPHLQKYTERSTMAAKGEYRNQEEKDKWLKVMKMEVMSSDESANEDGDEVLISHPLPWLSAEVVAFKQKMDAEIKRKKVLWHYVKPNVE